MLPSKAFDMNELSYGINLIHLAGRLREMEYRDDKYINVRPCLASLCDFLSQIHIYQPFIAIERVLHFGRS